jgi:hypothetical protein
VAKMKEFSFMFIRGQIRVTRLGDFVLKNKQILPNKKMIQATT